MEGVIIVDFGTYLNVKVKHLDRLQHFLNWLSWGGRSSKHANCRSRFLRVGSYFIRAVFSQSEGWLLVLGYVFRRTPHEVYYLYTREKC